MKVTIGLVGFGVIGTGVVRLLREHSRLMEQRTGAQLILKRIVDLDLTTDRGISPAPALLSADYRDVIADDEIQIVVELVGGTTVAHEIVQQALAAGKYLSDDPLVVLDMHRSAAVRSSLEQFREHLVDAIRAGVESGELREDLDVERSAEVVRILQLAFIEHLLNPEWIDASDERLIDASLDVLFRGLAREER